MNDSTNALTAEEIAAHAKDARRTAIIAKMTGVAVVVVGVVGINYAIKKLDEKSDSKK